ncbi:hypothetical protein KP509_02G005900 [Ceratopteris richardii]|uniref:Uncharacterized protein n=1 Tax=Ceratopteris richardii TaxID=49495 RepID=A0A8T2V745_CERRI|nr:hypothetical protein KP509_02G005900 [Ceratopteris richardii]
MRSQNLPSLSLFFSMHSGPPYDSRKQAPELLSLSPLSLFHESSESLHRHLLRSEIDSDHLCLSARNAILVAAKSLALPTCVHLLESPTAYLSSCVSSTPGIRFSLSTSKPISSEAALSLSNACVPTL